MAEQIIKTEYSEVMEKSYIDYAMSVICQRALELLIVGKVLKLVEITKFKVLIKLK